jgi:hypothetical protein
MDIGVFLIVHFEKKGAITIHAIAPSNNPTKKTE